MRQRVFIGWTAGSGGSRAARNAAPRFFRTIILRTTICVQSSLRTINLMDIELARQAASFVGALLILLAYGGHQMGWMNPRSAAYNVLNAIGSGILGYVALHPFQIGFVVLETVWTLISVYALVRPMPPASPGTVTR